MGVFLAQHRQTTFFPSFPGGFLPCRRTRPLPALESDPIRFGESFDVLPLTVYKRREVDAWKSELAHKIGEVQKTASTPAVPFFSRFAVVGHGALFQVDLLSWDTVPFFVGFAFLGHDVFPLFGLVERPRELVAASQICDLPGNLSSCEKVTLPPKFYPALSSQDRPGFPGARAEGI